MKLLYGIHIRALIVKIQESTNKCTILQYKPICIYGSYMYNIVVIQNFEQLVCGSTVST